MLGEVFYWVLNMSIAAAITGLIVILVRLVKKIPRGLTVFLWVIPFFRMTIPLGLNSPYSLMSLLSRITTKTIVVYQPADDVSFSMMNYVMATDIYFPITYKVNILENIFNITSVVWVIVFLAITLMLAVIYFTTLREMKDAKHLRDNIYLSDKITSPAVYGIINPRIMLLTSYEGKDTDLILLHEKMHVHYLKAKKVQMSLLLLLVAPKSG